MMLLSKRTFVMFVMLMTMNNMMVSGAENDTTDFMGALDPHSFAEGKWSHDGNNRVLYEGVSLADIGVPPPPPNEEDKYAPYPTEEIITPKPFHYHLRKST